MTKTELVLAVAANDVSQLCLYWTAESTTGYELWADSTILGRTRGGDRLITARGDIREFKSLDAGLKFIRACGYSGPVMIDQFDAPTLYRAV